LWFRQALVAASGSRVDDFGLIAELETPFELSIAGQQQGSTSGSQSRVGGGTTG